MNSKGAQQRSLLQFQHDISIFFEEKLKYTCKNTAHINKTITEISYHDNLNFYEITIKGENCVGFFEFI